MELARTSVEPGEVDGGQIGAAVDQSEGDSSIAVASAIEEVVRFLVEVVDGELGQILVLADQDVLGGEVEGALIDTSRVLGEGGEDEDLATLDPAVDECKEEVLVAGVGGVVEFAGEDSCRHDGLKTMRLVRDVDMQMSRSERTLEVEWICCCCKVSRQSEGVFIPFRSPVVEQEGALLWIFDPRTPQRASIE